MEQETNNLNSQIDEICATKNQLDSCDRTVLHKPIEETKKLAHKPKKAWIKRVRTYLKTALSRSHNRLKKSNTVIAQFFFPVRHRDPLPVHEKRPSSRNPTNADTYRLPWSLTSLVTNDPGI